MKMKANNSMTGATPFQVIPSEEFRIIYPEVYSEIPRFAEELKDLGVKQSVDGGVEAGEIKLPTGTWAACLVQDGVPYVFYDDDAGWQRCPNVKYEKTTRSL